MHAAAHRIRAAEQLGARAMCEQTHVYISYVHETNSHTMRPASYSDKCVAPELEILAAARLIAEQLCARAAVDVDTVHTHFRIHNILN